MIITIANLRFFGRHGVLPEEQMLGGRFGLDLILDYDATHAAESDDLHHAVDYARISLSVEKIVRGKSVKLIEALAAQIVDDLLQMYPRLDAVTVRLRKYHLPMEQMPDYVQVEHSRRRT